MRPRGARGPDPERAPDSRRHDSVGSGSHDHTGSAAQSARSGPTNREVGHGPPRASSPSSLPGARAGNPRGWPVHHPGTNRRIVPRGCRPATTSTRPPHLAATHGRPPLAPPGAHPGQPIRLGRHPGQRWGLGVRRHPWVRRPGFRMAWLKPAHRTSCGGGPRLSPAGLGSVQRHIGGVIQPVDRASMPRIQSDPGRKS